MPTAPLVSVLLAAHDAERYLRVAVASILWQSLRELELIVVDDGSSDTTADVLADFADARLRVLRNDERLGLAASLNRGLEEARGRYVARLDADDVAMPDRLERQVARMQERPAVAVLGSAALEVDERGQIGTLHRMPEGPARVRWAALFSSPFLHPTVLFERAALERHGLRYDPEFGESEDYDLWARLLVLEGGDNVPEPLVLYRTHPGQASQRRRELQESLQRRVALREIAGVAPGFDDRQAELAWSVGAGRAVAAEDAGDAAEAFVALLAAFEASHGPSAREAAAAALARVAPARSLRLSPAWPLRALQRRAARTAGERSARAVAVRRLAELEPGEEPPRPIRVAAVFPEPTPYRAPLLDLVAERPEVELTVVYAAGTVARRTWDVEPRHDAVFLRGLSIPGAWRVFRHDYPVTPGVVRALRASRPEVVVVSGWSTFAAQAAIMWSRVRHLPYLLVVESHDVDPRPGWRRALKGTVVPRVVRGAAGVLVTGTLARRSMLARGADPDRVGVFANTVDVEAFAERADELRAERDRLREELGIERGDVAVLSVARLAPEKAHDVLVRAVAAAGVAHVVLVIAGEGPERAALERLAREQGIRAILAGDVTWERIVELYVAADVFALLSEREPWGVVVNEAAACGLPLVLSDRVGASADLLRDGENGALVPVGDVEAAADALRRLAGDAELRRRYGARSRELASEWGYEPSVESFVAGVRRAGQLR